MRTYGRYVTPEPLKHNNQRKQDRITWALQGRSERGKIKLLRESKNDELWVAWFCDQVDDFPDPLAHDDGLDALAYVDQMAKANFESSQEVIEEDIDLTMYQH